MVYGLVLQLLLLALELLLVNGRLLQIFSVSIDRQLEILEPDSHPVLLRLSKTFNVLNVPNRETPTRSGSYRIHNWIPNLDRHN
jgi:hypothetical protein